MRVIGVDTGGTFTDFVYTEGDQLKVLKIPSTPRNPAEAILKGLSLIGGERRKIVHGTTVATNTLLERRGAKVALITNRGFEDVIEIGRQTRERLYDLKYRRESPLVPRELRFGIRGRLEKRGRVIEELDPEEIEDLATRIKDLGIEAVAVCLLHSYANPEHERKVGEVLRKTGVHVSLSHEILPEFREFERTSTTVVNAYVSPKMENYIESLEKGLPEGDLLRIMQSNGGIVSPDTVKKQAVRTILSGPAGGVIGALFVAQKAGFERIITLDMGGTSTDVSLVDRKPRITTESKIGGVPVKVPMVEIHTIGAGGGSVAYVDEGGVLRVGPRSAGADPGPVCYGKGEEITVTDANLFAGRLIPEFFLGGAMRIYPERVKPYMERIAREVGADPYEVAEAILKVVESNMERALRRVSVERGYNPKDFTLVSFGGAGGLHAVSLARSLGIPKVLVPRHPGILSALGMMVADIVRDYSKTVMLRGSEANPSLLKELFRELEEKALEDMAREGLPEEDVFLDPLLDMRYKGQSYELLIPFSESYEETFHREHERVYGYRHSADVEIVNLRLRAVGRTHKPELPSFETKSEEDPSNALIGEREVLFGSKFIKSKVYSRDRLVWGNVLEGPAVVVEYSSTTFLPPGTRGEVDRFGNLVLDVN